MHQVPESPKTNLSRNRVCMPHHERSGKGGLGGETPQKRDTRLTKHRSRCTLGSLVPSFFPLKIGRVGDILVSEGLFHKHKKDLTRREKTKGRAEQGTEGEKMKTKAQKAQKAQKAWPEVPLPTVLKVPEVR